ncbi:hypothetical protein [Acuticoccus sediminis]|uniref:hypothetical protein n=1 Tax=Acuticoccus sediminis TaxID=2184697 RepID=UPI001CFD1EF6|nr:hypothetical protein [Acuticoccus sediminis]
MILIPEIQTVVILVPRTGSGTLRRALLARYSNAMMIYRHMEADGVPQGYDRWAKVGVVRHPVDRLWSLYRFLQNFSGNHDPAYINAMRSSVDLPFSEWIVRNETVFTSPYDRAGKDRFFAGFTVRHPMPENVKSQFFYLRPDLGTRVWAFGELALLGASLGVDLSDRYNATDEKAAPALTEAAEDHVKRFFQWDLRAARAGVVA